MIEVRYKNTEEQFLKFSMYRAVNSKAYKRSIKMKTAMVSIMLIISSIVYGYVSMMRNSDEKIMKVGLVFSVVFFILGIVNIFVFPKYIYRTLKKTMMKNLKNSKDIFGKTIKVKFDGKIMDVYSGKSKLKIDLNSMLEVIEMDEYVCVSIRNHVGLVIPIASFKKEQDKVNFINGINACIDKNK